MSSAHALRAPQRDDAYTRLAELAAREAEINRNEAARRRAWREEARAHRVNHSVAIRLAEPPLSIPVQTEQAGEPEVDQSETVAPGRRAEDDFIDARLAELEERERTLADREKLIATLENLLDQSRQRLEEQLVQLAERNAAPRPARLSQRHEAVSQQAASNPDRAAGP